MKKHFTDYFGTAIGGITGWISSSFYDEWIQPILLSAVCAAVGYTVTLFCKWVKAHFEKRAERNAN